MSLHRAALLKLLNNDSRAGLADRPKVAAQILLEAVQWCSLEFASETILENPELSPHFLPALAVLAQAMEAAGTLSAQVATPEVENAAEIGSRLAKNLNRSEELMRRSDQLRQVEHELLALAEEERALKEHILERDQLAIRVQELNRIKYVGESMERLEEQAARLQTEEVHLKTIEKMESELVGSSERVSLLSERVLTKLQPTIKEWLTKADTAQQKIDNAITTINDAQERYNKANWALDERLPILQAFEQANQTVAGAFGTVIPIDDMLKKTEEMLSAVNSALKDALLARQRDMERLYKRQPM